MPFEGPVAVSITFVLKRPRTNKKRKYPSVRPDLDNYAKLVTDVGNGLLYKDDGQIIQLYVQKTYGTKATIWIQVLEVG